MKIGLFSNSRRPNFALRDAWKEDIDEIVLADRLGFAEAWISEHESPAELIIAKAAALTSRIMLGSGVRPVPCYHPFQIGAEALACDHLTDGRYMLGVGPGFTKLKTEMRGGNFEERRAVTEEMILTLKKLFTATEPFDLDSKYWSGKNLKLPQAFVQKPYPPIAVAIINSRESAINAGVQDLLVLMADFSSAKQIKETGEALEEGQRRAGQAPSRDPLRACRVVFVGETDKEARDAMRESYDRVIKWEIVHTPHHQRDRIPAGGTLEDITFDYLVDTGNLFIGSPETVRQMIEDLYDQTGGFGGLMLHCGRNYATHEKVLNSMRLFGEKVLPRIEGLDTVAEKQRAVA